MPSLLIDKPVKPKARLLLAHGAGAPAESDFMQQLTAHLLQHDIEVWRFNFPYMQQQLLQQKKRLPDKIAELKHHYQQLLQQCPADLPLFCGGKSMGGRVASLLTEQPSVKAVFVYGYPFHPPKKDNWRTEHFPELQCPLFIIQGDRDPFGNKTELAVKSWPQVTLFWLAEGNHDFLPAKRSGVTQTILMQQSATFTSEKIDEILLET